MIDNDSQNNGKINLERYQDLDGVTLKKLNFGLWFVGHIKLIKKILFWLLMLAGGIAWLYFIYTFGFYVIKGMKDDDKLLANMVAVRPIEHKFIQNISAKPLVASEVQVFNTSGNKYDFLVRIENPSQRHWADLSYYFLVDGQPSEKLKNYIFPNESKYLTFLAKELNSRPGSVEFIMENPSWHRIDAKKIPNWEMYKMEHLNIEVKNASYVPPRTSGLSEKINLGQIGFTVSNLSPYNYWKVNFTTLLYSDGSIVGVNQYFADSLKSGETRVIEANYPGQFGRIDKLEVIPEVNFMDTTVYEKFIGSGVLPIEEVEKRF